MRRKRSVARRSKGMARIKETTNNRMAEKSAAPIPLPRPAESTNSISNSMSTKGAYKTPGSNPPPPDSRR